MNTEGNPWVHQEALPTPGVWYRYVVHYRPGYLSSHNPLLEIWRAKPGAAFEKMSDEEAFFAVDNSIPALTGRINYVDQMIGSGEDATPGQSQVTFNLAGNKLNKQQVMNFFKLWMLAVGPTNDE